MARATASCFPIESLVKLIVFRPQSNRLRIRKGTFDIFNFLASQYRQLPEMVGPFDEEDDEVTLKPSRCVGGGRFFFRHLLKTSKQIAADAARRLCLTRRFTFSALRRATSSELPMAMRFRHLEKLSKEAVGVYR